MFLYRQLFQAYSIIYTCSNPTTDNRTPAWEVAHHLIRALDKLGETGAASLLAQVGIDKGETAKDLSLSSI